VKNDNITPIKIQTSLNLLNVYALNADFSVLIRVDQKLISIKEVNPINSQPKNITKKFPLVTSIIILITNKLINKIKRSTFASYLKYENKYIYTNVAIDIVNNIKL